jgi:DNA-3-methyladenine glycosylase II
MKAPHSTPNRLVGVINSIFENAQREYVAEAAKRISHRFTSAISSSLMRGVRLLYRIVLAKFTDMKSKLTPLNLRTLAQAVHSLANLDSDLAKIAVDLGPPPLWERQQGFQTLIHIILEQQVSLSSARAAFDRLLAVATPLTPERFLQLNDTELKSVGFSRQKASYGRCLADAIVRRDLDIAALNSMDDETVRSELMKIKGIGRWTSDIYLLMAMLRPDIWPRGDLALAQAVKEVKRLRDRPTEEELSRISSEWEPWRSVAARLLWHYYLSRGAVGAI